MHGANDEIVSPMYMLEAKEYFGVHGIKIKTKLFNNCEHKIPVEGTSLGLDFLKKILQFRSVLLRFQHLDPRILAEQYRFVVTQHFYHGHN